MSRNLIYRGAVAVALVFVVLSASAAAQRKGTKKAVRVAGPVVKRIDIIGLKKALQPAGKPLLVNFWATWCEPCREEFPDLVKLSAEYKDRVDVITISLDELSEIARDVPKFLSKMKATMPAFLLYTRDEDAAIKLVAPNWAGSLPMTIIYAPNGAKAYTRMGKFKHETVTAELNKLLPPTPDPPLGKAAQ